MKRREIVLTGKTDSQGRIHFYNKSQFDEFMRSWPNASFQIMAQLQPTGTSEALLGYYRNYILPEFQKAWKEIVGEMLTIDGVENEMKQITASMKTNRIEEREYGDYMPVEKAGNHRMIEYIDELKVLGAMQLDVEIQDPRSI